MSEVRAGALRVLAIARRELQATFGQPPAWVFLAAFLALAAGPALPRFFAQGVADLREPLAWLRVALLLLAPAAAMRLWAEERAAGTFELLFTLPVRPVEAVLGKFLAGLVLIAAGLALWAAVPLTLSALGDVDPGQVAAGALGALLLGATLLAGGMLASALTRSQVVAFVGGASFGAALVLGAAPDVLERVLPHALVEAAADLGAPRHLEAFDRGVLDTGHAAYFVGLTALLLGANALVVARRGGPRLEPALALGLGALVALLGVDLLAQRPLRARLDLTLARANTLAPALREALRGLDQPLTVRAYVTRDLPPGFEHLRPQVRALVDLLHDVRDAAPGRVLLDLRDPLGGDDLLERQRLVRQAEQDGVAPVVVGTVSEDQAGELRLYAGLALLLGDRAPAVVPRAILAGDLEYELAVALSRVTLPRLRVALSGDGLGDYGQARAALGRAYAVEELDLEARDVPADVALLVHAAPVPPSARTLAAVDEHLRRGGRALLLVDTHAVDPAAWSATPFPADPLTTWLRARGVALGPGLALAPTERPHTFEVDGALVRSRYPWLVEVGPAHDPASPVLAGVGRALLPFAAPLGPAGSAPDVAWTPLVRTAPGWVAGREGGPVDVHPLRPVSAARERAPAPQVLAGAVTGPLAPGAPPGRLVVVGDSDFCRDRNARDGDGVPLLQNLVDWALDRALLAPVRARGQPAPLRADAALLGWTGERAQGAAIVLLCWALPGLVLGGGLAGLEVARRRRAARAARARDARAAAVPTALDRGEAP
ncbi:MAG: Gldg family protein [Planctomycetes bacterium]|nr:Gldg family protein [Planctomycetota bacterium]